jgi:hypothetical protein
MVQVIESADRGTTDDIALELRVRRGADGKTQGRQRMRLTYTDLCIEERAAALGYQEAFRALVSNDLRRGPDGLIIDHPAEDAQLARNLTQAARRWARLLDALGRPHPPGLLERTDLEAVTF